MLSSDVIRTAACTKSEFGEFTRASPAREYTPVNMRGDSRKSYQGAQLEYTQEDVISIALLTRLKRAGVGKKLRSLILEQ